MKKTVFTLIASLLLSSLVFAHGEEKPGPHGGFIRMPGAFHTELVPDSDVEFKMYLLDVNWQNPSVKDSAVDIKIMNESTSAAVSCKQGVDFFQCQLVKGFTLEKGKLSVKASREKAIGGKVFYNLPLSFDSDGGRGPHE
ncbi:MAG TPA: hypothetical protein PLJ21_01365 [Pseudobdellovibrionaceae bacterium]|nr:hypothetical protein [Pseudobdellovibrionaceae bacterium]